MLVNPASESDQQQLQWKDVHGGDCTDISGARIGLDRDSPRNPKPPGRNDLQVGRIFGRYAIDVISIFPSGAPISIKVWDKNEMNPQTLLVTGHQNSADKTFVGILATGDTTIGRVNIYDTGGGFEGILLIEVYVVPAPGSLALLGLAGLVGTRRRRE